MKFSSFNSRYLGFSIAPGIEVRDFCVNFLDLSIPVTWDFPLHLDILQILKRSRGQTFNSRYLGFSIAPLQYLFMNNLFENYLSIPVTWDFPLHLLGVREPSQTSLTSFNSRYLGFSIAPQMPRTRTGKIIVSFQFPLLGIFHCTLCCGTFLGRLKRMLFQFPLLGIFHCTFHSGTEFLNEYLAFNSRYLGFSIAPNNINSN